MKTIKNAILLLCLICVTTVFFNSCKKENGPSDSLQPTAAQLAKAKRDLGTQMQASGIVENFPINKRLSSVYLDKDWNVTAPPNHSARTSSCLGNPANYIDVIGFTRAYRCSYGYIMTAEYNISWDNDVVYTNPVTTTLKTSGTFRVSIPGNANAHNDVSTSVVITNLGADPLYPGSTIFNVKVESSPLVYLSPATVNTSGAVLRIGAKFASDCNPAEQDNYPLTNVVGILLDVPLGSAPCSRNDKAWYQPPGAFHAQKIGVYGFDPLGLCPSYTAGTPPSYQKIQYSINNGASWNPFFTNGSAFIQINGTEYVGNEDYAVSALLSSGTYDVKIRYANVYLNSGVPVGTYPHSGNSCITGGWTTILWTEETRTGVVIP